MQVAESQAIAASHLKEIERLTGELENLNIKLQNCVPAEEKEALNNDFLQLLMKIDVKTAKMDELKQKASADKVSEQESVQKQNYFYLLNHSLT